MSFLPFILSDLVLPGCVSYFSPDTVSVYPYISVRTTVQYYSTDAVAAVLRWKMEPT